MLNLQFYIISNALATAKFHARNFSLNITPEDLQEALVVTLEHCGAHIEPVDRIVDLDQQKKCFDHYRNQAAENVFNLFKKRLIESHPDESLSNFTVNDVLRLNDRKIVIPEIIEVLRNWTEKDDFDFPLGFDTPIDAKTWSIVSHFYLAAIKEDFKQLFVNYPDDSTMKTWQEIGVNQEISALYEAYTGNKLSIVPTDRMTLEAYFRFIIEDSSTFYGSKVIHIEDLTSFPLAWDMPILFFGSLLLQPEHWFPVGEVPEVLLKISQTHNDRYTHSLKNVEQEEAAMSLGDFLEMLMGVHKMMLKPRSP